VIAYDTNIFISYFESAANPKQATATALIERALERRDAIIGFQVVQETLNVLTTAARRPAMASDAGEFLERVLLRLWRINPSEMLYRRALALSSRYQLHFYDALVVAGAIEGGCDRLLTEDLQHGQVIEGLRIENPFL
jgi:predicted nucleic acid-binding protein